MTNETRKARAQYLNGLAVAVMSVATSAILAGAPWWVLPAAGLASITLHWAAARAAR